MKKNSNIFKGDPSKRLKLVESTTDALGYKHFRYAPVVNGVPIKDSQVIVHVDKSDNVYAVNGELHNQSAAKTDNSQKVSSEKALHSLSKLSANHQTLFLTERPKTAIKPN